MTARQGNCGLLIVFEGSDGSGKATQSRLLLRRLKAAGRPTVRIAFPGYHRSFFGGMAAAYLRGEFGASSEVDPHLAAVLYAGDRWEAREKIVSWLDAGKVVVCDRYVDSNKAHQAARLGDATREKEFLRWVDRLEFGVFKLPKPNFTIFLHVPLRKANELIERKGRRAYLRDRRRDIHEADQGHLRNAERIYLQLASRRPPQRGALIECVEEGSLLPRREIAERVWRALTERGVIRL
jgi:dTMP kinase